MDENHKSIERTMRLVSRRHGAAFAIFLIAATAAGKDSPLFPKAEFDKKEIQEAIRFEWELRKHYDVLPQEGEAWFKIIEGKSTVLISAPHATAQTREGKSKFADSGTGALAVALHQLCDATVIYTTLRSPSDPNFYDDNDYKRELRRLVQEKRPRLVIDLHVSHWYRPYDIDFGTLEGKSLARHSTWLPHFAEIFRSCGLRNFSQDYFSASKEQTVTKFVYGLGVPCVQMEINQTWLSFFDDAGLAEADKTQLKSEPEDIANDALRVDEGGAHRFAEVLEGLIRINAWVERRP